MTRLDLVLDTVEQGVVTVDAGFRLTFCNARWRSMMGLPEAMTRPGEVRRAALYTARKQRIAAAIAAIGARGTLLRANGNLDDAVQRPVLSRGTKLTVPEILSHFRGRR